MGIRRPNAVRLAAVVLVTILLAGAGGISPAAAHATIVKASIKPGAVLAAAPSTIMATFAEGVDPRGSFLRVFEGTGDHGEVDLGNSTVSFKNAKQMTVGLPKKMGKGQYLVMWYTVSADDGHKAGGSFAFTVK